MLSRYTLVVSTGIAVLGWVASALPPFNTVMIPAPWTVLIMAFAIMVIFATISFSSAARWSSPTLFAENVRLSRLPTEPIRFAEFGGETWAAISCGGWVFKAARVNSVTNSALCVVPAELLEMYTEHFMVARVHLYRMSKQSVKVLARSRKFAQLFKAFDVDAEGIEGDKRSFYFGFHSGGPEGESSLHPDAMHLAKMTKLDLNEWAKSLSVDQIELQQVVSGLSRTRDEQLRVWRQITGSPEARTIVRREEEDRR